ncbi:MAG: CYTH domain-containing protein [Bacteroidales bacterium]
MAFEIERKFLVNQQEWSKQICDESFKIVQGYLHIDSNKVVRIRHQGEEAFITVKSKLEGIKRLEFEYPIPLADAQDILEKLVDQKIEKTRHILIFDNKKWEIDVFEGKLSGLILAEIELDFEDEEVSLPPWLAKEVSHDERYYNANLIDISSIDEL